MAEEEARFNIDGKEYEIPSIDSFTMDEAQILWEYSSMSLGDFAVDDDDPEGEQVRAEIQEKLRNPGFMRTLMHVAYQRGNPKIPAGRVKVLIGQVNLVEAMAAMAALAGEDDAGPPEQSRSSEPATSSDASSSSSSSDSGNDSAEGSDVPDDFPSPTGIRSLPSSISEARTSAA